MAKTNPIAPVLTAQDIQRFWSKVDKTPGQGPKGECWEWTAGRDLDGYGRFYFDQDGQNRKCGSARIAHFLETGEWAAESTCHHCDHPPCCRPDHLFSGSQKANLTDAKEKGRTLQGEKHPKAKLNNETVQTMRALYATGLYSKRAIAKQFGLGISTLQRILHRQSWSHVP